MSPRRLALPAFLLCSLALSLDDAGRRPTELTAAEAPPPATASSCITCHAGIEDIHPGFKLSCVDCHGGDNTATKKEAAHVQPTRPRPNDERVLPQHYDLPYQRFLNPSNLRVAQQVCGDCHGDLVTHLERSLHGTTAGHLGDGFYENGLTDTKKPTYSIFPVRDDDGDIPEHAVAATTQVPPFKSHGSRDRIETHFSDLPRKACMQCHLYSEGRAVDGRLGMDGDYRGEGCAACHVTYAEDGRSRSRDKTIDKFEPGHPLKHRFTSRIPTDTCVRCHYGDASIGLHYRGLAQLVPGMPAGPEVKGTTDSLQNGVFYIRDDDLTPPDVHHERGMHCIDCHTLADTMGDGNIYPQMDHAVEIECTSCHGTYDRVTDLTTSHGRRIPNLFKRGDDFFLQSKVTGKYHPVVQVAHLLDPQHPDYNRDAAAAMNSDHARLECYACHSGWNVNFFGFHFDRNEQFTQLDLLSGERTPGRVTTQEKVFATFNQLRLGFNHEGMIAPYMVGFSTIGSAHDKNGEPILWQATPETQAGLSGVTLIPHQMHSVRPEPRTCSECHRSPATYGLGSTNFRLTREFGYAVNQTGLHSIALDGQTPARTAAVADVEIAGYPRTLGLRTDPIHARSTHAYVGCEDGKLAIVSLRNPVIPKLIAAEKRLLDPRDMLVRGDVLYVADGAGGVLTFDVQQPAAPKPLGALATADARKLALDYPWLLVADGEGGLIIADVSDPAEPRFLSSIDLNGEASEPNEALDVAVLFQYSRTYQTRGDRLARTPARHLAFVACGLDGVRIVDFTEPDDPVMLMTPTVTRTFAYNRGDVRGIAVNTVFDIGSAGGGLKSRERDYLYVNVTQGTQNRQTNVQVYDVSDPARPLRIPRGGAVRVYGGTGHLHMFRAYNAPFLKHHVIAEGAGGIGTLVDVSKMTAGAELAAVWAGVPGLRDLAIEEFAFDRLQDERGNWIKDISHDGCRYLTPDEVLTALRAEIPTTEYRRDRYGNAVGTPATPRPKPKEDR